MYSFKSVLSPHMEQLIAYKKSLNMSISRYKSVLRSIDQYYVEKHITSPNITKDIVTDWLEQTSLNNRPATKAIKLEVMRALCLYMAKNGMQSYVPRFSYKDKSTYVPYIFSEAEIEDIFDVCANWRITRAKMQNPIFAIPAIIRLLYSTGMRVSEATQLTNADVDLKTRSITLNNTKNKKQRMIPICESLLCTLKQYKAARNKLPIRGLTRANNPFFVSANGTPYDKRVVYDWFREVLKKANIAHKGRNYGPRVHDLRHTFAVHALRRNIEEGRDIYCTLPILSVFMGHANIYSTEKYVRLTKEVYPQLIHQIDKEITDIFPHLNDSFTNEDEG